MLLIHESFNNFYYTFILTILFLPNYIGNVANTLRVGLVGLDHWHAPIHYKSFLESGAEVVGGCFSMQGNLNHLRQNIHPTLSSCPLFPTLEALVSATKPDFLMAMAPHDELPKLATSLFSLGIPFGIEKSLGRNAREVEPLAELSVKTGLYSAVAFPNRYSRLWYHIHQEQTSHRSISHAYFRIINGSPERYVRDGVSWMLDPSRSGGGCLRNLGTHLADAFLYLTGNSNYRVAGAALHARIFGKPVEEYATAILISETGVIGTIETGYSFPTLAAGGDFEWLVAMEQTYYIDRETILYAKHIDGEPITLPNLTQEERYREFARDTLDRLIRGQPPKATIVDCYRAMLLLDRIYESAGIPVY